MTQFNILGLILVSLIFFGGCKGSKDDPNEVIFISDELKVDMWEELAETDRGLVFKISTIANLECHNFRLAYSLSRPSDAIILSLDNVIEPENCEPGDAPARSIVTIGTLGTGNYDIEINLKNNDIVNTGKLFVFNDRYQLNLITEHGLVLTHEPLFRVPNQSYWGYIGFNELTNVDEIQHDFFQSLESISVNGNNRQGDFGYFKVTEDQTIEIESEQSYEKRSNFFFQLTGSEVELKDVIENLRNTYGNEIDLKIFTSTGGIL